MAHNLAMTSEGQARLVLNKPAWHKLGTVLDRCFTWEEAEQKAKLDFAVFHDQLSWNGNPVESYGTFRLDKFSPREDAIFLGNVGKDYNVIHHSKGFETMDLLVSSVDGAHYVAAGALGQGETVWGQADLKLAMNVGREEITTYLLFVTGYIGNYSHTYKMVAVQAVCANTLSMALSERNRAKFKIKHTKNANDRVVEAQDALRAIQGDMKTVEEKLNFLTTRKVTRESLTNVFDRLFPKTKAKDETAGQDIEVSPTRRENILVKILEDYESNRGDAFPEHRGSAYALLNGVTHFVDFERSAKNGEQALSAMFGNGDTLKQKALQVILDSAGKEMPVYKYDTQVFTPRPTVEVGGLLGSILEEHHK